MQILFLAHRIPVPPNKGEKIRAYHELCYLARDHEVDLLALADDPSDLTHLHLLREVCRRVEIVEQGTVERRLAVARALLRGTAISLDSFFSPELRRLAHRWQSETAYDAVIAFSSTMAQYVDLSTGAMRLMDFVDVDSAKWEQYAEEAVWPLSWIYGREGRLVAELEAKIARDFDTSVFISEPEAALFRTRVPGAGELRVVPNGVGEQFLTARWRPPEGDRRAPNLAFMGTMDYRPNVDGVKWFCEEVLGTVQRAIPGTTFTIIGGRPSRLVRRLAGHTGVRLAGFVEDLCAELNRADLFVAPLRIARGVQNKVLEALAYGLPVVSTPQALEGIEAEPERHLLVAEDGAGFAQAVIESLHNRPQAVAMGELASAHVATQYRWERAMAPLAALLVEPETLEVA